jgi:PST family polysaccharide transporter
MMLTRLGPKMVFLLSAAGVGLTLPAFGITLWAFGLMPAIGAWITCSVVMLFVGAKLLLRELGGRLSALLGHLIRPLIGSAAMALVVLAIKGVLPVGAAWVGDLAFLLLLALAGALSYVLSVWVLWQLAGRPATAELQVLSVARVSLRRKV